MVAVYHKLSYIMFSCVGNDILVLVGVAEVDKTEVSLLFSTPANITILRVLIEE